MPYTDMDMDRLRSYAPDLELPHDAAEFWEATLRESRALAEPAVFEKVRTEMTAVEVFDVTFSGFGGHPIRGWLQLPVDVEGPVPGIVSFPGYGGGRGLPIEVTHFALAGYATLVVDTRGQGSSWRTGDTPDPEGSDPAHPGFMTRGILHPSTYYYRRVFADAVLALDTIRQHPRVQPEHVGVAGASQGGGISLAVAGLAADLWCVLADVPFLCDFSRATQIAATDPYGEVVRYLRAHRLQADTVLATLSYFDAAAIARRATAPALFSVALMDEICPPSTVYAAFNLYGGPKSMVEYPFNGHEGGAAFQQTAQLRWLAELRGSDTPT
ncbi:MAG: acetylxylan esterase [Actinomycetota bacterium]|nr:acetylxylan esterase [Actinomycetota bacterium]